MRRKGIKINPKFKFRSLFSISSAHSVARIWCKEGHETKIKLFKGDAQKYYELHAVKSDKGVRLYTVLLDRQPHEVEWHSLCGSKMTKKNLTVGSRGGTCLSAP